MWGSVWMTTVLVFGFAVGSSDGQGAGQPLGQPSGQPLGQHLVVQQGNLAPGSWSHGGIARPASYTYFSSNARDGSGTLVQVNQPTVGAHQRIPSGLPRRPPNLYPAGHVVTPRPSAAVEVFYPQDGPRAQFRFPALGQSRVGGSQPGIAFPVNTVLPGNALTFEKGKFPGLLRSVSDYSDVTRPPVPPVPLVPTPPPLPLVPPPPPRHAKERLFVTHNAITLPPSKEGLKTSTQTRITNEDMYAEIGSQPIRDFTETIRNTKADKGSVVERMQHVRLHEGEDGSLAESLVQFKAGDKKIGGSKGHESEHGEEKDEHHHTVKGDKGEKAYKKKHKHHKGGKGHHDEERDSSKYEENLKKENKHFKGEGFYGEHHKSKKEGKEKKYGEGGKHKKGHSTHGEHNIVKKDEYIKSTKFYDEDHDGGEHEERGEFYGHHEEKKGESKEAGHKVSDFHEKDAEKKSHHDKGHVDEEHKGHESGEGHERHYNHGVDYGKHKGGHVTKKWGHSSGYKH